MIPALKYTDEPLFVPKAGGKDTEILTDFINYIKKHYPYLTVMSHKVYSITYTKDRKTITDTVGEPSGIHNTRIESDLVQAIIPVIDNFKKNEHPATIATSLDYFVITKLNVIKPVQPYKIDAFMVTECICFK